MIIQFLGLENNESTYVNRRDSGSNRRLICMEIHFCTLRDVYWFYLELTPRVVGGFILTKYQIP